MSEKSNNRISLKGILGQDPKFFTTSEQKPVAALSIGTRDRYKDDNGEWQNRKMVWHNDCLIFNENVINDAKQFKKDDLVALTGELNYRKFTTSEGHSRNAASIIVKSLARLEIQS